MMELDQENEADSRLEDDDHMMVVITMVKDDMLMLMEKEDDGRVSQEDSITTVMMEEVGGLEMVKCTVKTITWTRFKVFTVSTQTQNKLGQAMPLPSPVKVRAF